MRALALPLLLAVPLAGCSASFDAAQVRACRLAIPALNPGTRIEVERSGPGPRRGILRIVYTVEEPSRPLRRRTIDCVFAGDGGSLPRGALAGVASDGIPMAEASFLLLRRFYLEDRAEPPVDPGPPRTGK
ncbi:hypothetical protein ABE438_08205 [Bosea sp. TWI1241]|uniref:hypothetical protein n=1 Tax=Bosea sp. TWI1241 TaxID=3148904 RepID=UPI0032080604